MNRSALNFPALEELRFSLRQEFPVALRASIALGDFENLLRLECAFNERHHICINSITDVANRIRGFGINRPGC